MATTTATATVPIIRVDTTLNSLRSSGYTLEAAVGEPIDNSLEARANNVRLKLIESTQKLQVTKKKQETVKIVDKIGIGDDGDGMPTDVLHRCLVLGESTRYGSRNGMGRFGVGGTLGAISQARRIEVYSRTSPNEPYQYTYIDLDEISAHQQEAMIVPEPRELPAEFADLMDPKSAGTLVVWSKCDQLFSESSKTIKLKEVRSVERVRTSLIKWIARTYRYFLVNGTNIEVDNAKVVPHDPLYLMPSRFPEDPKANLEFEHTLEWPIPSDPERTAQITVRMTLLPEAWRPKMFSGKQTTFVRDRRIEENEPLSIVRANREIFFDIIPRFYPDNVREIARWVGVEITFEPVLDEAFQVRNVKRGVEPVDDLRHALRKIVQPVMDTLVERVRKQWRENENAEKQQRGVHNAAEDIAAEAEKTSVKPRAGRNTPPEERDAKIDEIAEKAAKTAEEQATDKEGKDGGEPAPPPPTAEDFRQRLRSMPFSIVDDHWPGNEFFSTEHLGQNTIVTYNNKHPFFAKIYSKILAAAGLNTDGAAASVTPEKLAAVARVVQIGLDLLIVAYAKAEAMDDDAENAHLYSSLRTQWGLFLSQMVQRVPEADL